MTTMKLTPQFLFMSCFVFSVNCLYNDTFVRYFVWPMAAAATSGNPELCVTDNFKHGEFIQSTEVQCDFLNKDTCKGFVALSHSDKAIIISFRGSQNFEIELQVIGAIIRKPVSAFGGKGNVLNYFLRAFTDVWTSGLENDFINSKNAYPDYELWITGHSLGGAMASIAATTIATSNLFDANKIKLITFGQPRTGDKTYANLVDTIIPYALRIIHKNDIVPAVPPRFLYDYRHHKSEVWFENDMDIGDSWIECDEDESKKCHDGEHKLEPSDHNLYYGVGVGMASHGCKGWNPYV